MHYSDTGEKIPDSWVRKPMEQGSALLHLFRIWNDHKHIAHPQIVMTFALESLWLDQRLDKPVYEEIKAIIKSGNVLDHDGVYRKWLHKQELGKINQEKLAEKSKPKQTYRPKSRGLL